MCFKCLNRQFKQAITSQVKEKHINTSIDKQFMCNVLLHHKSTNSSTHNTRFFSTNSTEQKNDVSKQSRGVAMTMT